MREHRYGNTIYGGATVTANDGSSYFGADPSITVTKTAVPTSLPWPGGEFTYTVVVTNDGTIPVTLTSLTDSVYSGTMTGAALPVVIPVGGSEEYTFKVSHTEIGTYPNIVTAVARDARGNEDTATANALVTVDEPSLDARIAIRKITSDGTNEGDGLSIPEGTPITWKYYVTSTGTIAHSGIAQGQPQPDGPVQPVAHAEPRRWCLVHDVLLDVHEGGDVPRHHDGHRQVRLQDVHRSRRCQIYRCRVDRRVGLRHRPRVQER